MSEWAYVAIAYTVVWGALAVYAVVLARRVTQAQNVAETLRDAVRDDDQGSEGDDMICDGQPAP